MSKQILRAKEFQVDGVVHPTIPEDFNKFLYRCKTEMLATATKTILDLSACIDDLSSELDQFFEYLECEIIQPEYLKTHQRLPGGISNARLRKKRRDYLWRWWGHQMSESS